MSVCVAVDITWCRLWSLVYFWLYSCKSLVTGVIVVITTYEYVTSGSFGERVRATAGCCFCCIVFRACSV